MSASARNSALNRMSDDASRLRSVFSATRTLRLVSVASYTTPIPPLPIGRSMRNRSVPPKSVMLLARHGHEPEHWAHMHVAKSYPASSREVLGELRPLQSAKVHWPDAAHLEMGFELSSKQTP